MVRNPASNKIKYDLLFIFILSLAMSLPLFCNKIIVMQDGESAFIKSTIMYQSWKEGDFIPRWTPYLVRGYGYPMFNFYAPLFSYLAAFLMMLSIPVFIAFNLAVILVLFLSGVGMYLFAREIWGRQGALLSAAAYLLAPYHILNLYVRGAIAEFTALAFFPFVLWAIYCVMRNINYRDMAIGIFACAGLILSHNISALLFFPTAFFYLFFLFITDAEKNIKKLFAGLIVLGGGILLTAYFWLPALFEKKFVNIERSLSGYYHYENHFILFSQLISPYWPKESQGLSFMVGLVHILLAMAVIIFSPKIFKAVSGCARQVFFFSLLLIISIFFMIKISLPLWQAIPLLSFTQFPWRFLMCTIVAVSLLSGGFIFIFPESLRKKVLGVAMGSVILFNIFLCHPFGYQKINFTSPVGFLKVSLPMDNMEYLPKWVKEINLFPPAEKLQVVMGHSEVIGKKGNERDQHYYVFAETQTVFCYHSYYFPGWEVQIDGKGIGIHPDNPLGAIMFAVPQGEHEVRVYFGTTAIRQIGERITLFGLFFIIFLLIIFKVKGLIRAG